MGTCPQRIFRPYGGRSGRTRRAGSYGRTRRGWVLTRNIICHGLVEPAAQKNRPAATTSHSRMHPTAGLEVQTRTPERQRPHQMRRPAEPRPAAEARRHLHGADGLGRRGAGGAGEVHLPEGSSVGRSRAGRDHGPDLPGGRLRRQAQGVGPQALRRHHLRRPGEEPRRRSRPGQPGRSPSWRRSSSPTACAGTSH